MVNVWFVPQNW